MTTIISSLMGPLLLLTIGPCVLNKLVTFVRERASAVQILMLRQKYHALEGQENQEYEDTEIYD